MTNPPGGPVGRPRPGRTRGQGQGQGQRQRREREQRPEPEPEPGAEPGQPEPQQPQQPCPGEDAGSASAIAALLEDSAEDLYENAPCGYLCTLLDGSIAKVNATLLAWLGYEREELVGRMHFIDLLTVGGQIYHETHFAPLLWMRGELAGIALELTAASGEKLPVLVTSTVRRSPEGQPLLIRTIVSDARDRRAYEAELLRARKEAERDRKVAEGERSRVQEVLVTLQKSLLPPSLPAVPGLDALATYHVAAPDQLGGDFYDLFLVGEGRWDFFLGDVCGKGPSAATVTSVIRYTLRAASQHSADPLSVLRTLNDALYERYADADDGYCSLITGTLTRTGGAYRVTLAGGGHPPALLLRAAGSAEYLPTPGGMPAGMLPDAGFAQAGVTLWPGDTLLFYTDGLTEARTDSHGSRYGDAALLAFAGRLAPATAAETVEAVNTLLESFGCGLQDDAAVLALGVPALPSGRG